MLQACNPTLACVHRHANTDEVTPLPAYSYVLTSMAEPSPWTFIFLKGTGPFLSDLESSWKTETLQRVAQRCSPLKPGSFESYVKLPFVNEEAQSCSGRGKRERKVTTRVEEENGGQG